MTRHSRVATIVFPQVCTDDAAKARQFGRLIEGLDAGYSADRRALEEITRGRALADAFGGVGDARAIYEAAVSIAPKQAFLFQQWALFESNHKQGSLIDAERLAATARELDPRNKSIIHTQAEIDRKRANAESSPLMTESLRRRARARLDDMPLHDRFAVSTRCKILVDELEELKSALPEDAKPHEALHFAEKVKDTEGAILRASNCIPTTPTSFRSRPDLGGKWIKRTKLSRP